MHVYLPADKVFMITLIEKLIITVNWKAYAITHVKKKSGVETLSQVKISRFQNILSKCW